VEQHTNRATAADIVRVQISDGILQHDHDGTELFKTPTNTSSIAHTRRTSYRYEYHLQEAHTKSADSVHG
jgi:hypothetical protein